MVGGGHIGSQLLVFPDRKVQGRYPVLDGDDQVVATIATTWTGSSFTAVDADGRPLCTGRAAMWGLSGRWTTTGPDGGPLLTVVKSVWRAQAVVTLASGGTLTVAGSVWKREFAVSDAAGRAVLAATPRTSALSLHPHDFAVRRHPDGLTVPEVVALVQSWRMARKSDDATAAGGAAAGVAATSG